MLRWYGTRSNLVGPDLAAFLECLIRKLRTPYYPERHYMRG